jgi:hypothetical protein
MGFQIGCPKRIFFVRVQVLHIPMRKRALNFRNAPTLGVQQPPVDFAKGLVQDTKMRTFVTVSIRWQGEIRRLHSTRQGTAYYELNPVWPGTRAVRVPNIPGLLLSNRREGTVEGIVLAHQFQECFVRASFVFGGFGARIVRGLAVTEYPDVLVPTGGRGRDPLG